MNILGAREGQIRLISWGLSALVMLSLYLLLGIFEVNQPKQNEAPAESLLRWVRTIVPATPQERIRRARVRERINRKIPTIEMRRQGADERFQTRRPIQQSTTRQIQVDERLQDPTLDLRERRTSNSGPAALWVENSEPGERESTRLDLGGDTNGGVRVTSPEDVAGGGGQNELPQRSLEKVLARFMGCEGSSFPGGICSVKGRPHRFWICEIQDVTRVLLLAGDEAHGLVLGGEGWNLQSYRRGILEENGILRSLHAPLERGEEFRQALLRHLENRND